jgi:hypothetical protein
MAVPGEAHAGQGDRLFARLDAKLTDYPYQALDRQIIDATVVAASNQLNT